MYRFPVLVLVSIPAPTVQPVHPKSSLRKVSAASNGLAAGPANALAHINHESNLQTKKQRFKIN
jgi:hypothetical protein